MGSKFFLETIPLTGCDAEGKSRNRQIAAFK
jgi:hypothetical protein